VASTHACCVWTTSTPPRHTREPLDAPVPTLDLGPGTDFGSPAVGVGASADATGTSPILAPTDYGPAANPPDPSAEIAPAIALLETTNSPLPPSDANSLPLPGNATASTSLTPGLGLGAGPLPVPSRLSIRG
jgi:hypothetical protein